MPRKKHKPEEIVAKLRQVDVLVSQGQSTAVTKTLKITLKGKAKAGKASVTTFRS